MTNNAINVLLRSNRTLHALSLLMTKPCWQSAIIISLVHQLILWEFLYILVYILTHKQLSQSTFQALMKAQDASYCLFPTPSLPCSKKKTTKTGEIWQGGIIIIMYIWLFTKRMTSGLPMYNYASFSTTGMHHSQQSSSEA